MQVVHQVQGMKTGQHIALIKEDRTNAQTGSMSTMWGVSIDSSINHSVVIVCNGLTVAANLLHVMEQAVKSGEITGIQEG